MRLIDADKLLAMVKKNAPFIYHVALPIVALTHTEDAEPVRHGEWIDHPDDRCSLFNGWECSECKQIVSGGKGNYCPNCGAKMDGGKQDAE